MADRTLIEWTDMTWNPITGCSVVSPGCTNCYAMKLAGTRLKHIPSRKGLTRDTKAGPVWNGKVRFNREWLDQPLRIRSPRMIFVCAHGDLFAEEVPDEWIDQIFAVMALSPQHTFQVLTKRPERMREYFRTTHDLEWSERLMKGARQAAPMYQPWTVQMSDAAIHPGAPSAILLPKSLEHVRRNAQTFPLPNVWLGVSVEDQPRADERIPILLDTPAGIRFVSAEPLLGPINIFDTIDWIIVGGESGAGARPMHPDWVRSIRNQCIMSGTPFFFKQWGLWSPDRPLEGRWHDFNPPVQPAMFPVGKKRAGRILDGQTHSEMPEVRECPFM